MSHQDIKRLAAIVALNPSDAAAATALTQAQARAGQESTRSRTLRLIADLNRAEALAPSHEAAVADDPSLVALRAAVTAAVKGAADVVAATAEDFGHAREWEADLSEEVTTALEVLDAAAATLRGRCHGRRQDLTPTTTSLEQLATWIDDAWEPDMDTDTVEMTAHLQVIWRGQVIGQAEWSAEALRPA